MESLRAHERAPAQGLPQLDEVNSTFGVRVGISLDGDKGRQRPAPTLRRRPQQPRQGPQGPRTDTTRCSNSTRPGSTSCCRAPPGSIRRRAPTARPPRTPTGCSPSSAAGTGRAVPASSIGALHPRRRPQPHRVAGAGPHRPRRDRDRRCPGPSSHSRAPTKTHQLTLRERGHHSGFAVSAPTAASHGPDVRCRCGSQELASAWSARGPSGAWWRSTRRRSGMRIGQRRHPLGRVLVQLRPVRPGGLHGQACATPASHGHPARHRMSGLCCGDSGA